MWPSIVFGSLLILLSLGLVIAHLATRRGEQAAAQDDRERAYLTRRFFRRMQASILIGLVGLAVLGGLWVDEPPAEALYWCGVLLAVLYIVMLAGADAVSTQTFFHGVQKRRVAEHVALQKEVERCRRYEGNGENEPENEPPR